MTISESFGRAARRIQQRIHVASQGHLGRHLLSVSCLLLGMNRRRTGRSRVAALGHLADGDRLTVAVLNGRPRRPPGWLCSLETDARTEIWVARRRLRASAAAVQRDDDAQREQRGRINANNRGHHDRLSGEDRSRGAARRSHAAVSPLETLPRDKPPAATTGARQPRWPADDRPGAFRFLPSRGDGPLGKVTGERTLLAVGGEADGCREETIRRHGLRRTALAGTVLAACGNASTGVSTSGNTEGVCPHRIIVGGLSSITGPLPADFAPAIAGAQAYFDWVNDHGGVNGRRIDLAYKLDDQSDPSVDATQARTLVEQDHVFAVVPVATPSFSGGPFLSQHDVPTFGLNVNPNIDWAGPSMYGNTGSYTAFSSAQLQAAYLAEQHHVRAAAIAYNISQSSEGCQGVANAFRQYGIRIAFEDLAVPVPAFDLNADVTRMKSAGVDMVTSCLDLTGDILLSHTMQQDGMTG